VSAYQKGGEEVFARFLSTTGKKKKKKERGKKKKKKKKKRLGTRISNIKG